MRRFALFLTLFLLVALAGCGNTNKTQPFNISIDKYFSPELSSGDASGFSGALNKGVTSSETIENDVAKKELPSEISEGDIVNTDGNYIYIISNRKLFIIKGKDKINLSGFYKFEKQYSPRLIVIKFGKIFVIGNYYDKQIYNSNTFVKVFVPDEGNLKEIKELRFAGSFLEEKDSDNIYIVTQNNPVYFLKSLPMPNYLLNFPRRSYNSKWIKIYSIGEDLKTKSKSFAFDDYAYKTFLSGKSLFLFIGKYISKERIAQKVFVKNVLPYLNESQKSLVAEIDDIKPQILSLAEKRDKIYGIASEAFLELDNKTQKKIQSTLSKEVNATLKKYKYLDYTKVIRIALNDFSKFEGEFPGRIALSGLSRSPPGSTISRR
jgi:uncharacterized secreted protein with C-terminal beta-propeller domain